MARVSVTSFSDVDVPWATIQSISSGATSALRSAFVIARDWPRPVGSGALMWNASAVRGGGDGVGGEAPPRPLGEGRRPPPQRMLRRLDHDDAGTFPKDESVAC